MRRVVLVLAVCACAAVSVIGQQSPRPKLPGEDWVQLFNGTDLTGWLPVGKEKWTVENGVIQGMTLTDGYGYLKTDKPYKDFHLSLRFMCVGTGNSGTSAYDTRVTSSNRSASPESPDPRITPTAGRSLPMRSRIAAAAAVAADFP